MATGLQSLLQDTVALSQELLFEAGMNGALRVVNPAWTSVLGWSEPELKARTLHDLVHADDLEKTSAAFRRAVESAGVVALDTRCVAKDGSYRSFSWKIVARDDVLLGAGHEVATPEGAKAVHDINNLMQTIVGALELVRRLLATGRLDETDRFMTSAISAAHRAAELNQQRSIPSPTPSGSPVAEKTPP